MSLLDIIALVAFGILTAICVAVGAMFIGAAHAAGLMESQDDDVDY